MQFRSKVMGAMLAAVLLATTSACGSNSNTAAPAGNPASGAASDGKVTLKVMHYYTKEEADSGDIVRKVSRDAVLKFGEENADKVVLDISEIQHNDYETKVQSLAAANDLPDVFAMKGSWVENFVKNGMLADISEELANVEWRDEYRDYLFVPVTLDGKYYGAPMQFSSTAIAYYNKDLWKQAGYDSFPATWDELLAAAPKFQEMGITTVALGNKGKWQYNSSWISIIGDRYTGSDWTESIIAKDGKAKFTDPEFVKALELTERIGKSGILNADYLSTDNQQASASFSQGKAATQIDGYWNVNYLENNTDPEILKNFELAPLPAVEGGKGDQTSITAGCGWFVGVNNKLQGEQRDLAIQLALYMSGPVLSQGMSDYGNISTTYSVPSADAKIGEFSQKYLDFIDNASSTCTIYDSRINASVISVMNDRFPELLSGTTTPEAAAQAIQAEYETILKQ